MSLYFQSICSSSSGNCLALWSEKTRILVDCGLSSMKRTRGELASLFGDPGRVSSVLLTHTHSDHISYYPLRVLEEYGHTIRLHGDSVGQLRDKHFKGYGFKGLKIEPFEDGEFTVGEFSIRAFEVNHNPWYPTYGFRILWQDKKIVIVTDFCEWDSVFENFLDADFIFVESNHDLGLLRKYYNPNSRFHLPNPEAGNLLLNVVSESETGPATVMLGHISSQRNERGLAHCEIVDVFEGAGKQVEFELLTAPLRGRSEVIEVG